MGQTRCKIAKGFTSADVAAEALYNAEIVTLDKVQRSSSQRDDVTLEKAEGDWEVAWKDPSVYRMVRDNFMTDEQVITLANKVLE